MTNLMVAAWKGYPALARLLLEHGADVQAQAGSGYTALKIAANYDHDDVAALLREHGATQ